MGRASRRKWEAMLERSQLLLQVLQEQTKHMQPPLKALRAAWITLLMGAGLAVIFTFFWFGLILTYVGTIILAIDFLCEQWSRKWKSVAMLLPAFIIVATSVWAWGSAPLQIQMIRHYGDYKEDELIGGIHWKSQYSELRVSFTNSSDNDYSDFDAFISTDLGIVESGWIDTAPNCLLRLSDPRILDVRATGEDKEGNPIEELMTHLVSLNAPYHLHCDKLIRRDTIQMVFALANVTQKPDGKFDVTKPESLFGPKKLPTWSSVHGTYASVFRPFSFADRKQLIND